VPRVAWIPPRIDSRYGSVACERWLTDLPLRSRSSHDLTVLWPQPTSAATGSAFRERSQTLAWAKPCLAGRPTMLVRTQPPEQNTSRSHPSGMELPDYPVVVLTLHRRTRMGPHLRFPPGLFPDSSLVTLPAGSFFKFVPRYASRRPSAAPSCYDLARSSHPGISRRIVALDAG
jgi:hypothetical protein